MVHDIFIKIQDIEDESPDAQHLAGGIPHESLRVTMYDMVVSHFEPFADENGGIDCVRLSLSGGNGGTITTVIAAAQNVLVGAVV